VFFFWERINTTWLLWNTPNQRTVGRLWSKTRCTLNRSLLVQGMWPCGTVRCTPSRVVSTAGDCQASPARWRSRSCSTVTIFSSSMWTNYNISSPTDRRTCFQTSHGATRSRWKYACAHPHNAKVSASLFPTFWFDSRMRSLGCWAQGWFGASKRSKILARETMHFGRIGVRCDATYLVKRQLDATEFVAKRKLLLKRAIIREKLQSWCFSWCLPSYLAPRVSLFFCNEVFHGLALNWQPRWKQGALLTLFRKWRGAAY